MEDFVLYLKKLCIDKTTHTPNFLIFFKEEQPY